MVTQAKTLRGKTFLLRGPKSITSAAIHGAGWLLSIAALVLLLVSTTLQGGGAWRIVSFSVYGAGLISLYAASTLYHTFYISKKVHRILRKIDHIMVYFLIAATYTPLCLVTLNGAVGWVLFGVVWGLCLFGMAMKLFWIDAPRWVSAAAYLLIGGIVLLALLPLVQRMRPGGIALLLAGGGAYITGAFFYATKTPLVCAKRFGNHEIFHLCVLLGSICHFIMVYQYI